MPNQRTAPAPRSLQEWMDRTGNNSVRLSELVRAQTGRRISPTMMSFILRGSRRCSIVNALALHAVTGVPIKALREWPKVSGTVKELGGGTSHAA